MWIVFLFFTINLDKHIIKNLYLGLLIKQNLWNKYKIKKLKKYMSDFFGLIDLKQKIT